MSLKFSIDNIIVFSQIKWCKNYFAWWNAGSYPLFSPVWYYLLCTILLSSI